MNILKSYAIVNGKMELREFTSLSQEGNRFDLMPKLNHGEKFMGYKDGMAVIKKLTKKELSQLEP